MHERCKHPIPALCLILIAHIASGCGDRGGPAAQKPQQVAPSQSTESIFDFKGGPLEHYLVVQDALARDQLYEAQAALAKLGSLATYSEGDLKKHIQEATRATDIKTARQSFKAISEELIKRELPDSYKVAYCPMSFSYEGARWIQQDGKIMNPYFGADMLHCGAFEEEEKVDH